MVFGRGRQLCLGGEKGWGRKREAEERKREKSEEEGIMPPGLALAEAGL